LNVHGVVDIRQTEIQTTEPLVPEPSAFEVEMAVEKLKRHHSPGMDQIPAELIKARGREIHSEIHTQINSIGIRNCLSRGMNQSLPIHKEGDKKNRLVVIEAYHFCQLCKKILSNILLYINSKCRGNYWGSSVWILTQQVNY